MLLFQKSTVFGPKDKLSNCFLISEKLDGMRCTWIPQTRGLPALLCPLYNHLKESNPDSKISSGLWSNGGIPIYPPKWWVDQLPNFNLDGELWSGRGEFQFITSVVRGNQSKTENDERWRRIKFVVYDAPSTANLFTPRTVKVRNEVVTTWDRFKSDLVLGQCKNYVSPTLSFFQDVDKMLATAFPSYLDAQASVVHYVDQHQWKNESWMLGMLSSVLQRGGEGLIARSKYSIWTPERVKGMYKIKPSMEGEGVIVGATPGEKRLDGMIGALVVKLDNGKQFKLSGLTDAERTLWGYMGGDIDLDKMSHFKVGQRVTFRYRELSDDNVPKEARYYRERSDGE